MYYISSKKNVVIFFLFLVNLNIEKLFSLEIHVEKDMF